MFYYIACDSHNPSFNLALEQTVFEKLDRQHSYCMLWQNHNAIIVGKHQITAAEIDQAFVNAQGISVVRRLSGGGAVYHDLGNINFTFITGTQPGDSIDFAVFCRPVIAALRSFGVPAEISGRNDMTIEGKKFSGNAQYIKENRIMHHGTLLYDSNLDTLSRALNSGTKVISAGIKSVPSRVTNIRPFMKPDMSTEKFMEALRDHLFTALGMETYTLSAGETDCAQALCDEVYSQWSWNYGASPPHNIRKSRRIESCGMVEVLLDVGKDGSINAVAFHGDFFSGSDPCILASMLKGHRLEFGELSVFLQSIDVSRFLYNMDNQSFISLLLD